MSDVSSRHPSPEDLETTFLDTIRDYRMLAARDRVIVAVSGGKDSYTLFDLLGRLKDEHFSTVDFHVVTIETDLTCSGSIPPVEIQDKAKRWGMTYETIYYPISQESDGKVDCFYCALRRRTALIKRAFESGYNRIAMGHHLDDLVETLIMNMIHHGNLSTMPPRVDLFDGKISIIRPLSRVLEEQCRVYANSQTIVPAKKPCPGLSVSTRRDVKEFLGALEEVHPGTRANLFSSMRGL